MPPNSNYIMACWKPVKWQFVLAQWLWKHEPSCHNRKQIFLVLTQLLETPRRGSQNNLAQHHHSPCCQLPESSCTITIMTVHNELQTSNLPTMQINLILSQFTLHKNESTLNVHCCIVHAALHTNMSCTHMHTHAHCLQRQSNRRYHQHKLQPVTFNSCLLISSRQEKDQ